MKNPFAYSHYVTGDSFCNRKKELSEIMKYIEGSQNAILYSHRRYGKSSLIRQAFRQIRETKMDIGTVYVELYGATSEKDFILSSFHALTRLESSLERLVKFFSQAAKNIRLNLSVDPMSGETSISPSFDPFDEKIALEELMGAIERYSEKRKLAIAFDEFQETGQFGGEGFEKRLRSFIQGHENVCYIFSGSRRRLLADMFNSSGRAFYKMADSLPLERIGTRSYLPWIDGLFRRKDVRLPRSLMEEIVARFENHPMHIQNFLFHLWEEIPGRDASLETIDRVEREMIQRKNTEYATLWETLTLNQKKTLKLIIRNRGAGLFTAESLQSVGLKTGSAASKAIAALSEKEIILKNGVWKIQDIVFKKWLQKTLSM
ncbi:conserved hypothetical protein [Candidatus Desulfarcum epimagneticum]|uniref:ATPase domain-containing protein n=1 Tax=uncultured Desulfobacteraceae bacterium TaxID=218296 RepID=A0A484HI39_9BACT|nr:conserved hypothetical protein [uncultured Desulfobacteraceae bacterium]